MSENQKVIGAIAGSVLLTILGVFGLNETNVDTPLSPEPHAETPAVTANCPAGWSDESDAPQDTIVYSCTKDGWIVILTPDKKFERAWRPGLADWTQDREVAGWPD